MWSGLGPSTPGSLLGAAKQVAGASLGAARNVASATKNMARDSLSAALETATGKHFTHFSYISLALSACAEAGAAGLVWSMSALCALYCVLLQSSTMKPEMQR